MEHATAYDDFWGAWSAPAILLVDLDAFFASVEQLDHPEWRGKPVIVGGDAGKRGVVSTASYEARKFGVHSAMPSSTAARLCPDAIWTHGHYSRYKELSDLVMTILHDETPLVQQVSIDEAFMDVSPTRCNTEHPASIASRIQKRVMDEVGVTCSIGVGTTKTIAKIASEIEKPRGLTVVFPGREAEFLAPLPVGSMSGIGPKAQERLKRHGIKTLHQLSLADEGLLREIFGKNAQMMRERSVGGEANEVTTTSEMKSISHETSFAEDVTTRQDAFDALFSMAGKVGRRLRAKGLRAGTVGVKVKYHDLKISSAQARLSEPFDDELSIRSTLQDLLASVWNEGMPLRLIGVSATQLITAEEADAAPSQLSLFDGLSVDEEMEEPRDAHASNPSSTASSSSSKPTLDPYHSKEKRQELLKAMDQVRNRFSDKAVLTGGEVRTFENATGTSSKNAADYK